MAIRTRDYKNFVTVIFRAIQAWCNQHPARFSVRFRWNVDSFFNEDVD